MLVIFTYIFVKEGNSSCQIQKKKRLEDDDLKKVDGAGIFSRFTNDIYELAGVEVVGPGTFWNDGYRYKGQEISDATANVLAYYAFYECQPAESIEQAREYVLQHEGSAWDDRQYNRHGR